MLAPVPLSVEGVESIIHSNPERLSRADVSDELSAADFMSDQSKEFRFRHYPLILLILKNPPLNLVSTEPPQPEKVWDERKQGGLLYLYDERCPDYLRDGIEWKKTRMSVKLIIHNAEKGIFKLKNHKTDDGVAVMRRQTWQTNGWRKNEYKLIHRDNYFKMGPGGDITMNECQTLQDFPVLVHYFRKDTDGESTAAPIVKKRESIPTIPSTPANIRPIRSDLTVEPSAVHEKLLHIKTEAAELDVHPHKKSRKKDEEAFNSNRPPQLPAFSFVDSMLTIPDGDDHFMNLLHQDVNVYHTSNTSSHPLHPHIVSMAPDSAPATESTKVLAVLSGLDHQISSAQYYAHICGGEVPCQLIAPNVIEFRTPPTTSGLSQLSLIVRDASGNTLGQTPPHSFHFLPSDERGVLNLSNLRLTTQAIVSNDIIAKFRHTTRVLDLSHNELDSVEFLSQFHQLATLNLDNNRVSSSHPFLPHLPSLTTLFVNCNRLEDLDAFLEHLRERVPNLQILSLLGNDACGAFSGPPYYYNYRMSVLNKLPKLIQLDSVPFMK
ncbi:hypothetical protein PROFUN_04377 [Planoprotostelium fungivorum]|uniref:IPT/TIG domain-containing protein n=1 Tax=Planoprotostelium fungivorum TaxID=1890364 RepID=A0A2P6NHR7_9EUKA|nr:hypothetical protein PROFUN_04377 [Planoprotostelium fungivorum]